MSLTAGARRVYLFEATETACATTCIYSYCEPAIAGLFPASASGTLGLDPVGDAFPAAVRHGDVALQRVLPSDIAPPAFRRRFFDDAGIVERISIIQRGADAWRVINVSRHASDGRCSDGGVGLLIGLACLVLPMLPLNRRGAHAPRPPHRARA